MDVPGDVIAPSFSDSAVDSSSTTFGLLCSTYCTKSRTWLEVARAASSNDTGISGDRACRTYLAKTPPPTTFNASGPTEASRRPNRRARSATSNFTKERATIAESETFSLAATLSARVCGNASSPARGGTVDCSETFTRTSLQQNEFSPLNVTAEGQHAVSAYCGKFGDGNHEFSYPNVRRHSPKSNKNRDAMAAASHMPTARALSLRVLFQVL